MNSDILIEIIKGGLDIANSTITAITGAVISTLFVRRDTRNKEFEKIRAGKFNEVLDCLLLSGEMSYYEYYKANNFLEIARLADKYYQSDSKNTEQKKYEFDWFIRFFNRASEVSSKDMREYWAKVLLGEVVSPGQFSLRAIEVLYNMSIREAETFQKAANIVLQDLDDDYLIICTDTIDGIEDINEKYGFNHNALLALEECGLMNGSRLETRLSQAKPYGFISSDYYLEINKKENEQAIFITSCPMTRVAVQLLPIVSSSNSGDYIIDLGKALKKACSDIADVHVYKTLNKNGDEIEVDDSIDLLG